MVGKSVEQMETKWESRMVDWSADTMDSSLEYQWEEKTDSQTVSS